MKYIVLFVVLVGMHALQGCSDISLKTADYCHNSDGTYNSDDPRCQHPNPIIFDHDPGRHAI